MKFGAKLAHGFGVGEVGGGAPPDGDPEVGVNTDNFDEGPDRGFDEDERVSEVGSAGGKAMVEGRGAEGRRGGGGSGSWRRQRPGGEEFSEGLSDTKRGRGDCRWRRQKRREKCRQRESQ